MKNLMNENEAAVLYRYFRSHKDLEGVLISMQQKEGISKETAAHNADRMLYLMADRKALSELLAENPSVTVGRFLDGSRSLKTETRMKLLCRLYAALQTHQDAAGEEALFQSCYAAACANPAEEEPRLKQRIRELAENYQPSPDILRALAEKMRADSGENVAATCETLGEDGMRFLCVAAMELYLHNRNTMTMEEAVNATCTSAEIQAAADAVQCGKSSEKWLIAAVAVAVLAGILFGIHYEEKIVELIGKEEVMDIAANGSLSWEEAKFQLEHLIYDFVNGNPAGQEMMHDLALKEQLSYFGSVVLALFSPLVVKWGGALVTKTKYTQPVAQAHTAEVLDAAAARMEMETDVTEAMEEEARAVREAVQAREAQIRAMEQTADPERNIHTNRLGR